MLACFFYNIPHLDCIRACTQEVLNIFNFFWSWTSRWCRNASLSWSLHETIYKKRIETDDHQQLLEPRHNYPFPPSVTKITVDVSLTVTEDTSKSISITMGSKGRGMLIMFSFSEIISKLFPDHQDFPFTTGANQCGKILGWRSHINHNRLYIKCPVCNPFILEWKIPSYRHVPNCQSLTGNL